MADYKNGSNWFKWDLHVHTPLSIENSYRVQEGEDVWDKFIEDLEALPTEFKVIGINDYLFLDGYKRVLSYKDQGRLKNLDLILPVVELRIDKFGGVAGDLSRLNYHIIFDPGFGADQIERHFINMLGSYYKLTPQYSEQVEWDSAISRETLTELGQKIIDTVPAGERHKFSSPLKEGFNNLCFNLDEVKKLLEKSKFKDKVITAVGKTEWANIKWNDHTIAEKKSIICSTDIIFTAAESPERFQKSLNSLRDSNVNYKLFDCSDAHTFSSEANNKDRIGNCNLWVKADTSFNGLKFAINEYEDRVFCGHEPHALLNYRMNPGKFIKQLQVKKKNDAKTSESWFEFDLELSPELVAVIGNKGSGKSALADIIASLCNSPLEESFSFLNKNRFRRPKENKAADFLGEALLNDGTELKGDLNTSFDSSQLTYVQYLPQNYIESLCNSIEKINEFENELKSVIFSHLEEEKRLKTNSLDELIKLKTREISSLISEKKSEVSNLNKEIIDLLRDSSAESEKELQNKLDLKKKELETIKSLDIQAPVLPNSDSPEIKAIVDELNVHSNAIEGKKLIVKDLKEQKSNVTRQYEVLELALQKLEGLKLYIASFANDFNKSFQELNLKAEDFYKFSIDESKIVTMKADVLTAKNQLDTQINNLNGEITELDKKVLILKSQLDGPNAKYQEQFKAFQEWKSKMLAIEGASDAPDTIKYYEDQLAKIPEKKSSLLSYRQKRLEVSKEIHAQINKIVKMYQSLYSPVQTVAESVKFDKEKFDFKFEAGIVLGDFRDRFLSFISLNFTSSFSAKTGDDFLRKTLEKLDPKVETDVISFLAAIEQALYEDVRDGGNKSPTDPKQYLKKDRSIFELLNFIFSLDYLEPRFSLKLGDKDLTQVSPGERGLLLIFFYLMLDKNQTPLVIDQPEENLDNQTVYDVLVKCIKEAKKRRQIIIVTHNPNLAVVCDAEQVIYAELKKESNYKLVYTPGSLENPVVNKHVVDILEGTKPAFKNRDSKYY